MTEPARRASSQRLAAPKPTGALVAFRVALGTLVTVSAHPLPRLRLGRGAVRQADVLLHVLGLRVGRAAARRRGCTRSSSRSPCSASCFAAGLFYRVVAIVLFVAVRVRAAHRRDELAEPLLPRQPARCCSRRSCRSGARLARRLRVPSRRLDAFPAWCTYLLPLPGRRRLRLRRARQGDADWLLHAQPLNIWLSARTGLPLLGAIFDERWAAYAFSWAGFLFDTTIVAFLLWGARARTRTWWCSASTR